MAFTALAAAAVAGTGYSIYSGEKARGEQKKASLLTAQKADEASKAQDRQFNKLNAKQPDMSAILAAIGAQGGKGRSGTFLTGAGGAPTSGGMLGRSTLLGR